MPLISFFTRLLRQAVSPYQLLRQVNSTLTAGLGGLHLPTVGLLTPLPVLLLMEGQEQAKAKLLRSQSRCIC